MRYEVRPPPPALRVLRAPLSGRFAAALLVGTMAWASPARAADVLGAGAAPGADQIQFAAREHDLGYRAYLDKQFDDAATHFENAFFAAPNPAELRSAIRARRDAGELGRAATLAAIGLRRFPDDAATAKVASDVIASALPHVYEIRIASADEYSVAVDEKIVAVERVKESRIFVNPGAHELLVSWSDDRNVRIAIDAKEGEGETLRLEPPPSPPAVVPTPPPPNAVVPGPTVPVATVQVPNDATPPQSKPFKPTVFLVGVGLTAVGVGLTTWSGIHTINTPGVAAVRASCSAKLPSCPQLYNEGRGNQVQTTVALIATGSVAAATAIVGLFFTQWSPGASPGAPPASATPAAPASPKPAGLQVLPVVGLRELGVAGTF